jgi:hypothetical protein
MITRYMSSVDGLRWQDQGIGLSGQPGSRDPRGTRITAILEDDSLTVLYDVPASTSENWSRVDHSYRSEMLRSQSRPIVMAHCAMSVPSHSRTVVPGSTSKPPS